MAVLAALVEGLASPFVEAEGLAAPVAEAAFAERTLLGSLEAGRVAPPHEWSHAAKSKPLTSTPSPLVLHPHVRQQGHRPEQGPGSLRLACPSRNRRRPCTPRQTMQRGAWHRSHWHRRSHGPLWPQRLRKPSRRRPLVRSLHPSPATTSPYKPATRQGSPRSSAEAASWTVGLALDHHASAKRRTCRLPRTPRRSERAWPKEQLDPWDLG
mmetsp:Transcript_11332/g.35810  ORF Transcript_11332/g.35810 Transcript_11332/m.35810 type:complete len:211 (+) Transcript_11332:1505-2137(+)